ncbi:MAG: hypothetical protein WAL47_13925 [Pyrinomonadaceae bacterium]
MLLRLPLIASLLFCLPISIGAQQEKAHWQRVYTGEDSVIEMNVSSLRFEPQHIVRASYRTVLSKAEGLPEKSGKKYKSRIERIAFSSAGNRYRFEEVSWLDSNVQPVHSYQSGANADWKVLKAGGIMAKMFAAMAAAPPFGSWKILAYRFGEGPASGANTAPDAARLIGGRVILTLERVEVGGKVCSAPAFQSRQFTREEFARELGIELKTLGLTTSQADSIIIRCEEKGWQPPQSMLIQLPEGGMLILWEGLFLTLGQREHFRITPPYSLKRRVPTP